MSNYRHLETDRWADLESDPTDAIFAESFLDLPWELREPQDMPLETQGYTPPRSPRNADLAF